MGACPGTHPAPRGTAEEGLVTRGPTLTVGILAAADEGCQARRNRGLTCGGGSVMLGVSPGPGPSSGPGWVEAAPGGKEAPHHPSGGLGRGPLCSPRLWELIFTRGKSLGSQPSKTSRETPEPRPAIAREGKLRPRGRSAGIRWLWWQPGLCVGRTMPGAGPSASSFLGRGQGR